MNYYTNKENELKTLLQSIKENNLELPQNMNYYYLSKEMLDNIGSTDYVLRDNLIWSMLTKFITNKKLSYTQMKEILNSCLSEEHLFCGLGKVQDDSVFNRTFSMLIIDSIIDFNNKADKSFLSKEEVLNVLSKVIEYSNREVDLRGYVEGKGWAHSTAHTSDVLYSLANSKFIEHKELLDILELIKKKICVDTYTYINEEDERLVNAFMCIYNRNIIKDNEIVDWLNSFKNIGNQNLDLKGEHLRENRKIFFRSLYFRCKKFNISKLIIETIIDVLEGLPAYY